MTHKKMFQYTVVYWAAINTAVTQSAIVIGLTKCFTLNDPSRSKWDHQAQILSINCGRFHCGPQTKNVTIGVTMVFVTPTKLIIPTE